MASLDRLHELVSSTSSSSSLFSTASSSISITAQYASIPTHLSQLRDCIHQLSLFPSRFHTHSRHSSSSSSSSSIQAERDTLVHTAHLEADAIRSALKLLAEHAHIRFPASSTLSSSTSSSSSSSSSSKQEDDDDTRASRHLCRNLFHLYAHQFHRLLSNFHHHLQTFDDFVLLHTKRRLKLAAPQLSELAVSEYLERVRVDGVSEEKMNEMMMSFQLSATPTENVHQLVSVIEERHAQIIKLERDVRDIYELFRDLSYLVDTHNELLNRIDSHLLQAQHDTEQGHENVTQAEQYQTKARQRRNWLLAIGAGIVGAVTCVPVAAKVALA